MLKFYVILTRYDSFYIYMLFANNIELHNCKLWSVAKICQFDKLLILSKCFCPQLLLLENKIHF